jgi:hypothetical protein
LRYSAFSGLGATFVAMLSVPVGAIIIFIGGLLLFLPNGEFSFSLAVLIAAGIWLFFSLRSFASFRLEPTGSGFITSWPRLHRENFLAWSDIKLFHIVGPVFAVGVRWLFPFTWFVVRQHKSFLNQVHDHLSRPRQK